ncbi:unnamed protein product, partial [Discosporangium mesarthrocarpum]
EGSDRPSIGRTTREGDGSMGGSHHAHTHAHTHTSSRTSAPSRMNTGTRVSRDSPLAPGSRDLPGGNIREAPVSVSDHQDHPGGGDMGSGAARESRIGYAAVAAPRGAGGARGRAYDSDNLRGG